MGLLDQTILPSDYYNDSGGWGKYQFTSLDNIVNQFMIAYVGEDKLISKAKRSDIAFHAQRAIQELSFDTFKSCKAQEIEIPASLTMILPQDYVNYVKLTWSDSAGIEHIIYPTSKTSNPTPIVQDESGNVQEDLVTNGTFDTGGGSWSSQANSNSATQQSIGNAGNLAYIFGTNNILADAGQYKKIHQTIDIQSGKTYKLTYTIGDPPGGTMTGSVAAFLLSTTSSGEDAYYGSGGYDTVPGTYTKYITTGTLSTSTSSNSWAYNSAVDGKNLFFQNGSSTDNFKGTIDNVSLVDTTLTTQTESNTWSNFKSATPNENSESDDYKDDVYWPNTGQRYGLDPQHAQVNGSFYIDCNAGKIHFSSNMSGKTVILKYISDGLGTDEEMVVHKFAEEAMYKWIAYAVLSTRINIPEYIVNRFKKERFAETRKAKLRLSNIKLEEITQILRGKSKQIKH
jgi:hypothetical protein